MATRGPQTGVFKGAPVSSVLLYDRRLRSYKDFFYTQEQLQVENSATFTKYESLLWVSGTHVPNLDSVGLTGEPIVAEAPFLNDSPFSLIAVHTTCRPGQTLMTSRYGVHH